MNKKNHFFFHNYLYLANKYSPNEKESEILFWKLSSTISDEDRKQNLRAI